MSLVQPKLFIKKGKIVKNNLQEFLVLHKRHFGKVVAVVLSDDQVVLAQGLCCIKNLNPE